MTGDRSTALGRFMLAIVAAALTFYVSAGEPARAAGAPANVYVALSPSTITADGISTAGVTATVLDAAGNPVAGRSVVMFAPFDPGINFGPVHDHGNGTYTATLTASRLAETTPIFAAAASAPVHPATLTQLAASTTSLTVSTNPSVTNQGVTLFSTITTIAGTVVPPGGTVDFESGGAPIGGCTNVALPAQPGPSVTVTCPAAFAAPISPAHLRAVFTPTPGSLVEGSSSPTQSLSISRDPTTTTVSGPPSPRAASRFSYRASITPSQLGAISPTGTVRFMDSGRTIRGCRERPLRSGSVATCTVSYRTIGHHAIAAVYSGDRSFKGSGSPPIEVPVQARGTIATTMQWAFRYTPRYTQVMQLLVNAIPHGASLRLACRGAGCPFARLLVRPIHCRRGRKHCTESARLNLTSRFRRALGVGARLSVGVSRPGWVGKRFTFVVRAGRQPRVAIACTAPGTGRASPSCSSVEKTRCARSDAAQPSISLAAS